MEVYIRYHDGVLRVMREFLQLKWAEQMEELNSRTNPKIEGKRNPIIMKPAIKKKRNNYVIGKGQSQEEHRTCLVGQSNATEENIQERAFPSQNMPESEFGENDQSLELGGPRARSESEGLVAELKKEIMKKDDGMKAPVIRRKNSRYIEKAPPRNGKGDVMVRKSLEFAELNAPSQNTNDDDVFIRKKKTRRREDLSEIRDFKSDKRSVMMATAEEIDYWRKIDEQAEKNAIRDVMSLMKMKELPVENDYTQIKDRQSIISDQEGTIVERVEGGFLVDDGKKDWISNNSGHQKVKVEPKKIEVRPPPAVNQLELLHKKLKQKVKKKIKLSVQRIQKEVQKIDSPAIPKNRNLNGNRTQNRPPVRQLDYHRDQLTSQRPIQSDDPNRAEPKPNPKSKGCMYDMMIPNLIMTEEQDKQKKLKQKESPLKLKNQKFNPYLKLMGVKTKKEIREEDIRKLEDQRNERKPNPENRPIAPENNYNRNQIQESKVMNKQPTFPNRNQNQNANLPESEDHRESQNFQVIEPKRKQQRQRHSHAQNEPQISLMDIAPGESRIERLGLMVSEHQESRRQRDKKFQQRAEDRKINGMLRAEQNMKRDKIRQEELYHQIKKKKGGRQRENSETNRANQHPDILSQKQSSNQRAFGSHYAQGQEIHSNLGEPQMPEGARNMNLRRDGTRKKSAKRRATRPHKGYQPFVRNIKQFDLDEKAQQNKKLENQRNLRKLKKKHQNDFKMKDIRRSIEGAIDKLRTQGNGGNPQDNSAWDFHQIVPAQNNSNNVIRRRDTEVIQREPDPHHMFGSEMQGHKERTNSVALNQHNRWQQAILRNPFDDDDDEEDEEQTPDQYIDRTGQDLNGRRAGHQHETPNPNQKQSSKGTLKSIGQFSDFLKRFNLVEESAQPVQNNLQEMVAPAPTPTAEKNLQGQDEINRNHSHSNISHSHNPQIQIRNHNNIFQNPLNIQPRVTDQDFQDGIPTERQPTVFTRKPYLSRPDLSYLTSGAGSRHQAPHSKHTFTSEQHPPRNIPIQNNQMERDRQDRGIVGTSIELKVQQRNPEFHQRPNTYQQNSHLEYKKLNRTATLFRDPHYLPGNSGSHAILDQFKNQTGMIRNYYDHGEEEDDEEEEEINLDDTRFLRSGLPKSVSQMEKKRPTKKSLHKKSHKKSGNQRVSDYTSLNLGGQNFQMKNNGSQTRGALAVKNHAQDLVYKQIPNQSYSQNMESEDLEWKKHALIEQLSGAIGRAAISRVLNETMRWFRRKEQLDSYDLRRIEAAIGKRGSLDKRFLPTLYQLIDVEIAIKSSTVNRGK